MRLTFFTGLIAAVLIALMIFVVWYLFRVSPEVAHNVPEAGPVTLSGQMVCLPHRDTNGPQTLECAYGLLGEDGNYYMLQDETSTSGPAFTDIPTGTQVSVGGTFMPEEGTQYATVGVVSVVNITGANASSTTSTATTTNETHSDDTITFARPSDFGLAVSDEQILSKSVIPPCASGFTYCLYYIGDQYTGTNFESAGLAIDTRSDLTTENTCLTTAPTGYSDVSPAATSTGTRYSMSLFDSLGDAGAGHYTHDEQYRMYTADTCYQFTLRVGETQFANYPTGTIQEFTDTDRATMFDRLRTILESVTLDASGETLSIPHAS